VGGGGGGGGGTADSNGAGGGGAGGLITGTTSLTSGTPFTITVGAGGAGGLNSVSNSPGVLGGNSSLGLTTPGTYAASFNGTNQYLTTPSNAAFQFGTGDFTLECWFYVTYPFGTSLRQQVTQVFLYSITMENYFFQL
jgi:hypothetical protein